MLCTFSIRVWWRRYIKIKLSYVILHEASLPWVRQLMMAFTRIIWQPIILIRLTVLQLARNRYLITRLMGVNSLLVASKMQSKWHQSKRWILFTVKWFQSRYRLISTLNVYFPTRVTPCNDKSVFNSSVILYHKTSLWAIVKRQKSKLHKLVIPLSLLQLIFSLYLRYKSHID